MLIQYVDIALSPANPYIFWDLRFLNSCFSFLKKSILIDGIAHIYMNILWVILSVSKGEKEGGGGGGERERDWAK